MKYLFQNTAKTLNGFLNELTHFNLFWHGLRTYIKVWGELRSVAGPVIQANWRLSFEDDLRAGGLLYCVSQWTSIRTELADTVWSLWGNPGMARCRRKSNLNCWIHPAAQSTLGEQQWDFLVNCAHCGVGYQIKIGRPKFYAGKMIMPA